MMQRKFLIVMLCFFSLCSISAKAQNQDDKGDVQEKLPELKKPATCELALRYIDDAIVRMGKDSKTTLIIIVRMSEEEKSLKLSKARIKNIKDYLRGRGISNYEIALGDGTKNYGTYDIYVQGSFLYSMPVGKGKEFNLLRCWII